MSVNDSVKVKENKSGSSGVLRTKGHPRVFCNACECLHWGELGYKTKLRYGKVSESFTEYIGECNRGEIGILIKEIDTNEVHYVIPECMGYTTKGPRHMDWSKGIVGELIDDDYAEKLYKKGKVRKL